MSDIRSKLGELEAIYGSQKKAAEKLGVNVSTYRAYKTGKKNIPAAKAEKAKNLHRANYKKRRAPEFKESLAKKQKTAEKKRAKRFPGGAKTESLISWMRRKELPVHIQERLSGELPPFVAYPASGSDDTVQFVDAGDIAAQRYGKQEATRSLILAGLVIHLLTTNGKGGVVRRDPDEVEEAKEEEDVDQMDPFITRGKITTRTRKAWTLEETLQYAEQLFMQSDSFGKKLTPALFLGFQLP